MMIVITSHRGKMSLQYCLSYNTESGRTSDVRENIRSRARVTRVVPRRKRDHCRNLE